MRVKPYLPAAVAAAVAVALVIAPVAAVDAASAATPLDEYVYRTAAVSGTVTHTSYAAPTLVTLPTDGRRVDVEVVGQSGESAVGETGGRPPRAGGRGAIVTGYLPAQGQSLELDAVLANGGNGGTSGIEAWADGGAGGTAAGIIVRGWGNLPGPVVGSYLTVAGGGGGAGVGTFRHAYPDYCEGGTGGDAGIGDPGLRYRSGMPGGDRRGMSTPTSGMTIYICGAAEGGAPRPPEEPAKNATQGANGANGAPIPPGAVATFYEDLQGGGGGGGGGVGGGAGGAEGGGGGAGGGSYVDTSLREALVLPNADGPQNKAFARVSWSAPIPTELTASVLTPPRTHLLTTPVWHHGVPVTFAVHAGIPANVSDADVAAGGSINYTVNGTPWGSAPLGTDPALSLPMGSKNEVCFTFDPSSTVLATSPPVCITLANLSDGNATIGLDLPAHLDDARVYDGADCATGCYRLPYHAAGAALGLVLNAASPIEIESGSHPFPAGSTATITATNLASGAVSTSTVNLTRREGKNLVGRTSWSELTSDGFPQAVSPGTYRLHIAAFSAAVGNVVPDPRAADPILVRILRNPTRLEVADPVAVARGTTFTVPVRSVGPRTSLSFPASQELSLPLTPLAPTGALSAVVMQSNRVVAEAVVTTTPFARPLGSGGQEAHGLVTVAGDLPPGIYELRIGYGGSAIYADSTSSVPFTVTDGPSTTTLTGPGTLVYGSATSLVATPRSALGGAVTAGSVIFGASDGSTNVELGSAAVTSGTATLTLDGGPAALLRPGSYQLTARFGGGDGLLQSVSDPVTLTVLPAGAALAATPGRGEHGQPHVDVAVTAQSPSTAVPDGTVTLNAGGVEIGRAELVDGVARFAADRSGTPTEEALAAGRTATSVELAYPGSERFAAASGLSLDFGPARTSITPQTPAPTPRGSAIEVPLLVHAAPGVGPAITGDVVRAALHADPVGALTGSVWQDGAQVTAATVALTSLTPAPAPPGSTAAAAASATLGGDLPRGEYELRLAYAGSEHYWGAHQTMRFTVAAGPSLTSHTAPSTLVYGQDTRFAAAATSALGGAANSGIVTFTATPAASGALTLGMATIESGTAVLNSGGNAPPRLLPDNYQLLAHFDGGDGLLASRSVASELVVNRAGARLNAAIGEDRRGRPELQIRVDAAAPSRAVPDGEVTVSLNGAELGPLRLRDGLASMAVPAAGPKAATLVLSYPGSELFTAAEPRTLDLPPDTKTPGGKTPAGEKPEQGAPSAGAPTNSKANTLARSGIEPGWALSLAVLLLSAGLLTASSRRNRRRM